MNKSYVSVWNEALGSWVAASENTTARGKRSLLLSNAACPRMPSLTQRTTSTALSPGSAKYHPRTGLEMAVMMAYFPASVARTVMPAPWS